MQADKSALYNPKAIPQNIVNCSNNFASGYTREKTHTTQIDPCYWNARIANQPNGIEHGAIAADRKKQVGLFLQIGMFSKKCNILMEGDFAFQKIMKWFPNQKFTAPVFECFCKNTNVAQLVTVKFFPE